MKQRSHIRRSLLLFLIAFILNSCKSSNWHETGQLANSKEELSDQDRAMELTLRGIAEEIELESQRLEKLRTRSNDATVRQRASKLKEKEYPVRQQRIDASRELEILQRRLRGVRAELRVYEGWSTPDEVR